jgi:hypothetical protein
MNHCSVPAILERADVREFLSLLAARNARYLVIGGCAVLRYARFRPTGNIDIWIAREQDNADAVFRALEAMGAPLVCFSKEYFCEPGHFYRTGSPPVKIDDHLSMCGAVFDDAWAERETMEIEGIEVPFISRKHLIEARLSSRSLQDIVDVKYLMNAGECC